MAPEPPKSPAYELKEPEPTYDLRSSASSPYEHGHMETAHPPSSSKWQGLVDSFRRDPHAAVNPDLLGADSVDYRGPVIKKRHERDQWGREHFDLETAVAATAASPLSRSLKSRHLQMIAIGGSIGTGLFVGSGSSLATGGPASLTIAFCVIGIMLYCTVQALGEMAVLFPVAGSFSAYSTRFLDPAWGFAMGWNYAMQWLIALPLEIIAACYTISWWDQDTINNDAWVIIFLAIIMTINLFGVKGYGEAEFAFSMVKLIAVIGFIIMGLVLVIAGGPDGSFIGGRYWRDPGAFNNGFRGLCSVFANAAFAFAGTELVGLAAAETMNPRKSLPSAVKQVFWRITLFYVVSLTLVGLVVPYDNPGLLSAFNPADVAASPFVIAINNAGIAVLPSIFNAVILVSVLSVGNSAVFGSSRTLAALADQRQAPPFLAYIDRQGRPLRSILVAACVGFFAFFAGSDKQQVAFDWMIALSGLSSIFTWGSICLAHIRFRRAWRLQGHSLDELAFRSQAGVVGSWIGFVLNCLILVAQFWTGFAPVGYEDLSTGERVTSWFQAYLALPFVLVCYFPYKFWFRTKIARSRDMDLKTGMRELDISELLKEERAERAQWSRPKQVYKFFC